MNRRVNNHIISLLLVFAFMLPVIFHRNGETPVVLDDRTALLTLARGLPLLAVLLVISLSGSGPERKKRGWNIPLLTDMAWALLLFSATALAGFILPEGSPAYSMKIISGWKPVLIPLLALYAAASEEIFFRSWLIVNLEDLGGRGWPGILISAVLFGMMHFWQGFPAVIFAIAAGLLYGVFFQLRRNLFPLIAAHAGHNFLALVLASRL